MPPYIFKKKYLFLFSICFSLALNAQKARQKFTKSKVDTQKPKYDEIVFNEPDSIKAFAIIDSLKAGALKANNTEEIWNLDILRAYYYQVNYSYEDPAYLTPMKEITQKAKEAGVTFIETRASRSIADYYWREKNYEKAFEWILRCDKLLERMDPEDFKAMARHYVFIGQAYYYFSDYKKAIVYFKKASRIRRNLENAVAIIEAKNTLGLCYQKMGQLETSSQYFKAIIEDTSKFASPIWKGIASGNLGYNYYLKGMYPNAIPLLKTDIENALKMEDYGLAAGSTIPLAAIYLSQKKNKQSFQKIKEAHLYIKTSNQLDRLRNLYPVMSKWYAANSKPDSSARYMDSTLVALKRYDEKFNGLKIMRANQKIQAKEKEIEIAKLRAKSDLEIAQRNMAIGITVVLLAGGFVLFIYRNKYLLKKQEIKELELQQANDALENAKTKLNSLTQKARENSKLIETLKNSKASIDKKIVQELKTGIILTKEDWAEYQVLFQKAYPEYLSNLKSIYPALTDAELRCLCLLKLQLSYSEMAALLGVSTNTIMVTTHRIRKKLNLDNQEALITLVDNT